MSRFVATSLLLLLTCHGVGCGDHAAQQGDRRADVAQPAPPRPPAATRRVATADRVTEIALQRTPCFGTCPVYTLVIKADGTLRYHGERYVDRLGDHTGRIAKLRFEELARYAVDMDFMSLAADYSRPVTDNPTVFTSVTIDGQSKRIRDYARAGPERLQTFEKMISDSLTDVAWDAAAASP